MVVSWPLDKPDACKPFASSGWPGNGPGNGVYIHDCKVIPISTWTSDLLVWSLSGDIAEASFYMHLEVENFDREMRWYQHTRPWRWLWLMVTYYFWTVKLQHMLLGPSFRVQWFWPMPGETVGLLDDFNNLFVLDSRSSMTYNIIDIIQLVFEPAERFQLQTCIMKGLILFLNPSIFGCLVTLQALSFRSLLGWLLTVCSVETLQSHFVQDFQKDLLVSCTLNWFECQNLFCPVVAARLKIAPQPQWGLCSLSYVDVDHWAAHIHTKPKY